VGPVKIGGSRLTVIAGPCAVESREQILAAARAVKKSGAVILRGGAYKPRTSPYSFQGMGEAGLKLLKEASEETGMPVVSEIVGVGQVEMMQEYVDMLQIGARNMQNFELLKQAGASGMPIMLKRGMAATIEDWLMAAEYLLAHGAENVILCERGIRTFETYTRNTLDISSIPVVRKLSHLPVIVDPSHATGIREQVPPVALAGIAAGAAGLIVEVHPDPDKAFSDGPQSLFPEQFERLMRDVEAMAHVVEKELSRLPEKHETRPQFVSTEGVPGRATDVEGKIAVSFQGERGAFSEMALTRFFQSEAVEPTPMPEFRKVFDAVLEGRTRFGIVPIENSLVGSIRENYDLLLQYPDVHVIGETRIRIVHSLIALPDAEIEDIRRVYSQPPGLDQCRKFLDTHPDWELMPYHDTAGSVALIAREGRKDQAAIANSGAARVYGMKVLKEGIETNPLNYTRFVILARAEDATIADPDLAAIVFTTPDEPGALLQAMQTLAARGLNLQKIESRPIHGKPWNYMFYLDVEIPDDPSILDGALEDLHEVTEELRILGRYKRA
jgi:3-deoxy-7-phosphoheptulonate synthase